MNDLIKREGTTCVTEATKNADIKITLVQLQFLGFVPHTHLFLGSIDQWESRRVKLPNVITQSMRRARTLPWLYLY